MKIMKRQTSTKRMLLGFFNHGNEKKEKKITIRWEKRNVQTVFRGAIYYNTA